MAYCKKFINGINAINFSEKSVGVVKNALIAYAYQELKKESEAIDAQLAQLPEKIEGNEAADEQLALYKKKQQEINGDIKARMLALRDLVKVNLEEPIALGDTALFISEFAQNFRNIRHLADTLADAPAPVKKLQTNLYVEMLAKLGQAEQEEQLQTLSLDNITDMIKQATLMYESKPDDVQLRNQCQRLAQMGFYEIVRRDCAKVGAAAEVAQYDEYKEFLSKLRTKLPGVEASAIIDNLSQYKDSNGHSVADLLADVEGKFKITQKGDWDNSAKIGMVKERKALFDRLRFGQEDRREYARKTQANLTRDLFWARNIRDVELFTKDRNQSDKVFVSLAERRILRGNDSFRAGKATYLEITPPPKPKPQQGHVGAKIVAPWRPDDDPNTFKKFEEALDALWAVKDTIRTSADSTIQNKIKEVFAAAAKKPQVAVSPQGEISVTVYYFDFTDDELQAEILKQIKEGASNKTADRGFGRTIESILQGFVNNSDIRKRVHSKTLTGASLEEVQQKLTALGLDVEEGIGQAYQEGLEKVKVLIPETSRDISQIKIDGVKIDTNGELLLRKLSELKAIYDVIPPLLTISSQQLRTLQLKNAIDIFISQISNGKHDAKLNNLLTHAGGKAYAIAQLKVINPYLDIGSLQKADYDRLIGAAATQRQSNKVQVPPLGVEQRQALRTAEEILSQIHDVQKLATLARATGNEPFNALEGCEALNLPPKAYELLRHAAGLRLQEPFVHLAAGRYKEAIETPGLEALVTSAYKALAQLPPLTAEQAPESVKPIIQKAGTITKSAEQRKAKSEALEAAFQSGENVTEKVEAIFLAEYTDETIAATLGLKTEEDIRRLKKEIHGMAVEMVRLVERTKKGEPAISEEEQNAYFLVLHEVAKAIKPAGVDLLDVQFKVKHSSTGTVDVVVLNAAGEPVAGTPVRINLGAVKLPYSLVKPPGGEFIFSYGGTRGVIAPFEGLDEAYAGPGKQKGRLFTHSRLLGVGQYGSVKEVESLLFGLNQVVKKGYVPDADPKATTFDPKSRDELRTRPITARDDPLYRIESDVLQNLSKAEKAKKGALSGGTQYWIEQDKPRKAGKPEKLKLFLKDSAPRQYQILTERAKGDTLADVANAELNLYTKGAIEYHDPSRRPEKVKGKSFSDLKDIVSLSQAIVSEAQKFEALKFSHNDIKPENFLYKRNPDGSYQVKYIDWATGGFKKTYEGSKTEVADIFDELFGPNLSKTVTKELYRDSNGEFIERCTDANGRFVQKKADGGVIFGVKPTLQILHGARNGTLPYISPKVLGEPLRDKVPLSATAEPNPEMNTILDKPEDPYMDDWSLTAMAFGICNRQAYFSLVKGRAVGDYVIPTVLDVDGKDPQGLKITDLANFNKYFACGTPVSKEDFESGAVYTKTDGVMFIPSNQREGAPLHLYRRLQALQAELNEVVRVKGLPSAAAEQRIIDNIELILTDARRVVASGEGYSKEQLQEKLAAAQQCIKDYEQLNDLGHQQALAKGDVLQSVIRKTTATFHLLNETGKIKHLDILFTYPSNPEQVGQVKAVLDKVLPEDQINHIFLEDEAPGRHILKECIAQGQNELLKHLLSKITQSNPDFIAAVVKDGLLHYAAEQGMTDVFNSLVDTLKRAGASETEIFKFMMQEYGPGAERLATAPHIKWATNGLHIAVRNNNEVQLGTILALFPNEEAEKVVEETVSNLDDPGVLRTLVEATNNGPFKALEGCDQLNLNDQAYKSLQKVAAKRLELLQGKKKEVDAAQENLKWATAIAKFASEISEGGHDGQLAFLEKGKFSHYAHQRLKEIDGTLSLQRSTFTEELYTTAIMAVAAERKRQKVTANSENAARVLDEATNNVIGSAKLAVAIAKLAGEIAAGKHDKDLNTLKALSSGGQALVLAIRELKRIDDTLTIDDLSVEQSKLVETAAVQRAQQKEALAAAKVTARLSADANFKAIKESLHLCAVLGNKTLFNQIIAKYNVLNPEPGKKIDAKTILAILLPPDDTSPYHLFMRDEGTQDLAWTNLEENREFAKTFLLKSPVGTEAYPSLIAAKNGNFAGVKELIRLGEKLELSAEEWTAFFKQSDESGKTLLNYALEQEQFTFLTELLAKIKTNCGAAAEKTLVHLLSNPHPVNPLKNYLAVEKSEVKQFKVVNELLDAVCAKANPLKPELEQARLVALLVNKDWLIEKAQNEALHETLEKLLHSDALSIPFRRSLFAQLEKEAKEPAKTFFKGLLADVSPREEIPVAPIVAIQLPPGIMQEVARQSGNLNELIAALASDREAVRELQEQVRELTETQVQLRESLTQEKETVVQTKAQLAGMVRKVEQAEQSVSELRDEASRVLQEHTKRVEALEQEIAKRDEHSEKASLSLAKERADHQEALKGLQERLVLAESTRDNLASALKDTRGQLTTSLEAVQRLEGEAIELNALNKSLQEKLSASKLETVDARRVLGEELDAQRKETEKAQLEAHTTLSSLEELRIEHSSLERRAVQLGEDNKELSGKVLSLETQVRELTETQVQLRESLTQEKETVVQTKAQLASMVRKVEQAEQSVSELRDEASRVLQEHTKRVEALEQEIAKRDEHSEKASLSLAKERADHQEALKGLQERLILAESTRDNLASALKDTRGQLTTSLEAVQRLEGEAIELNALNKSLQEKLSASKLETVDARRVLGEELDAQRKETEKAQLEAHTTLSSLEELRIEHSSLERRAVQLGEDNKELSGKVLSLETQVRELTETQVQLRESLTQEKETVVQTKAQLASMVRKVEQAEQSVSELRDEASRVLQEHTKRVEALEQEIAKRDEHSEKASLSLAKERADHQEALKGLQERLVLAESTRDNLASALKDTRGQLTTSLEAVQRLEGEAIELNALNKSLQEKLSASKLETVDARRVLGEELDAQRKETEKAQLEAHTTLSSLEELRIEHSSLERRAVQLGEDNKELSGKVLSLETQVRELTETQVQLRESLTQEKETVVQTKAQLASMVRKVEQAEQSVSELRDEASRVLQEHTKRVEALEQEIAKRDEHSEKASLSLAKERADHQEALKGLQERLVLAESTRDNLASALKDTRGQLTTSLEAVQRLEGEAIELNALNKSLQEKLSASKLETVDARRVLGEELDAQRKETEKAQLEAHTTLSSLEELRIEHSSLERRAVQLGEDNKELSGKVLSLETQVRELTETQVQLRESLTQEKETVVQTKAQLASMVRKVEQAEQSVSELRDEASRVLQEHTKRVEALEQEIAKRDEHSEKASLSLAKERADHQEALKGLQERLVLAESTRDNLASALKDTRGQLTTSLEAVQRLEGEAIELNALNKSLQEKLSASKLETVDARRVLGEELDAQRKETEKAQLEAHTTLSSLEELRIEHSSLERRAVQLGEDNKELSGKVLSLETQVRELTETQVQLRESLTQEKETVVQTKAQLAGMVRKVEQAEQSVSELRDEASRVLQEHTKRVEALEQEIAKRDEHSEKASLSLAKERADHQEALKGLQERLVLAESTRDNLASALKDTRGQLTTSLEAVQRLEGEAIELNALNKSLQEKLSASKLETVDARRVLGEELDAQRKETEKAQLEAHTTLSSLEELRIEHSSLERRAVQLGEDNKELSGKVLSLETQVRELTETQVQLRESLTQEKETVVQTKAQLASMVRKVEQAEQSVSELRDEASRVLQEHTKRVEALEQEIAKRDEHSEKASLSLAKERADHQEALKGLQERLVLAESTRDNLASALKDTRGQLTTSLEAVQRLEGEAIELNALNKSLQEKLSASKLETVDARRVLGEELDAQRKETEKAQLEAHTTLSSLEELRIEHSSLERRAVQLGEDNKELSGKVLSLETQVRELTETQVQLRESLTQEKETVVQTKAQLASMVRKVEQAEQSVSELRDEASRVLQEHTKRVEALEQEIAKRDEHSEKASLSLAKERADHQEALKGLQERLVLAESTRDNLASALKDTRGQLTTSLEAVQRLEGEAIELNALNKSLQEKLSASKLETVDARRVLGEELDAQRKETEKAQLEAHTTLSSLEELRIEHSSLERRAVQLGEDNKELSGKVLSLETQVRELTETQVQLRESLTQEKETVVQTKAQLASMVRKVEQAEQSVSELRDEASRVLQEHTKRVEALEQEIAKRDEHSEKASLSLAKERADHQEALKGLQERLVLAESTRDNLASALKDTRGQLTTSLEAVQRLEGEAIELNALNKSLQEKLSASKLETVDARRVLGEELDAQRKETEKAQLEAHTTLSSLEELRIEHSSLERRAVQLGEDNKELSGKVLSLETQVRELTETQVQLRESLTQEKETVVQTKAQLASMVRKVEQAEQSVSELRDEASRVLQEHTKRVEALEQEIAKRDEHSEKASLSLAKERADHQEALKGLQERLVLAESTRDNLASALKDTRGQLTTSLEAVQRLEGEAIELNALNKSLQEKLSASKLETVDARRVLGEELDAQRKETEKAQLEAHTTLSSLEELRIEHSSLERRAVQLGEDNEQLSSKVEALQVTLREREEEILLVREAEARERQSALLKQAEIEQLVRQLAEVAEQKALLVLKPLIKESDNVALLTAIYGVDNPADLNLDDIGWNDGAHGEEVASVGAIRDIVWQAQIKTAADERLTALSQQASNALKATIRDSRELAALRQIADAEENGDLRVGGGFDAHVEFLRGNAYVGVRDEARDRLHALSEEASAALIESIRGSNNLVLLRAFADAGNNDALRGHGLDNHVDMLGNEDNYGNADAFETIKDEAELRLATLTQEAKDALIIEVNNSHDTDLLDRVARVGSNFDLRGSGLTVAHVDALSHIGAYADISAAARDRLNANQAAIVALTDFINGCDDARFLEAVSGEARTNEFLEVTFRMFRKGNADHLRALIKEDAHTQFSDLARARLLVLDAARHRRPDEPDPRIIAQEKAIHALQREIAVSKDKELLTAISTANSNASLNHNWHQVDELNLRNIQALVQDDAYLRVREAASRRIVALRDERNDKRDAYSDPGQYAATLAADRTTLIGINRRVGAIGTVDDKVRSELRQLGAMNPMHWFSPAFRGAAKKNAIAMEAHFTELATTCKVIVDYLVPLRNELVEQINSIPVNMDGFTGPQKKELQDRKALLTTYLRKVETELELYKPVYTQLYGDPRAVNPVLKDGILETIRRAKTDEGALEVFPFKSAATDHPMDERAAHFRAGYTSSATTVSARSTTLGLGARQARYTAGDAFKAGHFREHTINPDAARTGRYSGSYIEERASSYRTSLANASEYLSDLKLTITKFPEAPHGVPEDDPQLVEDRIHFAFACAVTLLSAFSEPPTASNQVILRGFEEKEMGYIWTALMTLGSEIPSMQFNHKAINVISPTFKPANELGTFYGYSSSSYQETLFKPHKAYVDNLLKGIKEACAERVIHQKTLEKADKLATSISSAYKSNFKQTMDELRENQDKGPEIFGR